MLFSTCLENVDVLFRPRQKNTPITTSNAIPSGTPTPTPTFTASFDPLDDAVLVLVAMVEVVDVVTEAAAGEGEAEPVTEDIVEDGKAEVVVTEEEVVDEDEVDELVVVTELPIVVKIEMEPARENVPFPV
ncbi:hypothetical protein EIK77_005529 [Talaromyces pinophilus]|jgi:hypothetical protein|nr:hypothetical protein EIK77_005529 [Talaromyces pinophilus]PCG94764.1 Hypothetical protein PENO1_076750 [Penicillium occitanis (nom. inval.)]PCG94949.1 hypothetical protein PENOC_080140 [Penicillium occitanis (nom. inval.)]